MFQNRNLLIATKHSKEKVIQPVFESNLGVRCVLAQNFNSDLLGTFTGEVERSDGVLETARKKCLMAMKLNKCDMAVASEGSFGPHPTLGFINVDDELLLFMDTKHNLEIVVREISLNTNFTGRKIENENELLSFAHNAKFPSHGLILRKAEGDNAEIIKGIKDLRNLKNAFYHLKNKYGSAYIETDMRAMANPMRMNVIADAAKKLVEKINTLCPSCNWPGFSVVEVNSGLPCSSCGLPTKSTLSHLYSCKKCFASKLKMHPNNKTTEEPTFCDFCNP